MVCHLDSYILFSIRKGKKIANFKKFQVLSTKELYSYIIPCFNKIAISVFPRVFFIQKISKKMADGYKLKVRNHIGL